MKALQSNQDPDVKLATSAEMNTPFLYAEESGLALFLNCRTGQQFCMDKEDWADLSLSLSRGWKPAGS